MSLTGQGHISSRQMLQSCSVRFLAIAHSSRYWDPVGFSEELAEGKEGWCTTAHGLEKFPRRATRVVVSPRQGDLLLDSLVLSSA